MLCGVRRPIAIVMDDVEGMNTGDKGGINNMIKLIRSKRTQRQKGEPAASCPIICVGGRHVDKKLGELKSAAAVVIDIPSPSQATIISIVTSRLPGIVPATVQEIVAYADGDLWRLRSVCTLIDRTPPTSHMSMLKQLRDFGRSETTTKTITARLLNEHASYSQHDSVMSETDRTSVGLLFHENLIDVLRASDESLYWNALTNFCFGDRIDRATFQKQIWSFNEMSSLIKTMYNQHVFHEHSQSASYSGTPRFTKVLTKYSTEYNNSVFLSSMSQRLGMDVKDLTAFFSGDGSETNLLAELDGRDVSKLDVSRAVKLLAPA
jgi:hypothetical protein